MKKVISDASPLIFSAKADLLGILKKLYQKIYVPHYVIQEIERPLELKISSPDVDKIKKMDFLIVENLTSKEIMKAKEMVRKHNIGFGEAQSGILFKRGGFETVIVADARAHRMLKQESVGVIDLVDVGFEAASKGILNPRRFADILYQKGHYRTQRILDILGRKS